MSSKNSLDNQQFLALLRDDTISAAVAALKEALDISRKGFASELRTRLNMKSRQSEQSAQIAEVENEWIGVESLSRLRSLVGGRFQNIKKKWVEAGFPLRKHRGDRWKSVKIDDKSWVDLSSWILKQGYEARLTAESEEYLFQLRQINKRKH